jgi:hypothetical protein
MTVVPVLKKEMCFPQIVAMRLLKTSIRLIIPHMRTSVWYLVVAWLLPAVVVVGLAHNN